MREDDRTGVSETRPDRQYRMPPCPIHSQFRVVGHDGGLLFVVGVEGHSGASFDTTEIGAPLLGDTTFDGQPDTRFSPAR